THARTQIRTHADTHTGARPHTDTSTHTHTHTHTHTGTSVCGPLLPDTQFTPQTNPHHEPLKHRCSFPQPPIQKLVSSSCTHTHTHTHSHTHTQSHTHTHTQNTGRAHSSTHVT